VIEVFKCSKKHTYIATLPRSSALLNTGSLVAEELDVIEKSYLDCSLQQVHWNKSFPTKEHK